jgi:hypothetical protein
LFAVTKALRRSFACFRQDLPIEALSNEEPGSLPEGIAEEIEMTDRGEVGER